MRIPGRTLRKKLSAKGGNAQIEECNCSRMRRYARNKENSPIFQVKCVRYFRRAMSIIAR